MSNSIGILTGKTIDNYIKNNNWNFKPPSDKFDWKRTLTLGNQVYLSSEDFPRTLTSNEYISIKPGEFVLLITNEEIDLPSDIMAFISMRFDYKQKGLVNVSGFHVDPNFHGKIIFSAYNASPKDIIIKNGEPMFMIFFQRIIISHSDKKEMDKNKRQGYDSIPANMIEQIQGKSATLASNANRLDKLEFNIKILTTIIGILSTIIFGTILKMILK